jgi:hypothetical protein
VVCLPCLLSLMTLANTNFLAKNTYCWANSVELKCSGSLVFVSCVPPPLFIGVKGKCMQTSWLFRCKTDCTASSKSSRRTCLPEKKAAGAYTILHAMQADGQTSGTSGGRKRSSSTCLAGPRVLAPLAACASSRRFRLPLARPRAACRLRVLEG